MKLATDDSPIIARAAIGALVLLISGLLFLYILGTRASAARG